MSRRTCGFLLAVPMVMVLGCSGGSAASTTPLGGSVDGGSVDGGSDRCASSGCGNGTGDGFRPPPPVKGTIEALGRTGAPSARADHTAVWTGKEMIVWGGTTGMSGAPHACADGGAYDPKTNTWRAISATGAPSPRSGHKAVWTGKYMAILGADVDLLPSQAVTGSLYDPATDTWRAMSTSGAPSARAYFAVVAVGKSIVVWGGNVESTSPGQGTVTPLSTGGVYDPDADHWTPTSESGAPSPPAGHQVGFDASGALLVFGGLDSTAYPRVIAFGAKYDLGTTSWAALPAPSEPLYQFDASLPVVWTGTRLIYLSAFDRSDNTGLTYAVNAYDASAAAWSHEALARGAAICGGGRVTSWSGKYMLQADPRCIFDPDARQAFSMPPAPLAIADEAPPGNLAEFAIQGQTQVWTGTELLTFGGRWHATETSTPCPPGAPCMAPQKYDGFALGARYVIGTD